MVFLEVRVAVRGTDRVGRGAKPKSSASFKDDGSNYLSARSCWLFIAPETLIVAVRDRPTAGELQVALVRGGEGRHDQRRCSGLIHAGLVLDGHGDGGRGGHVYRARLDVQGTAVVLRLE